jgi:hypothetical protein
MEELRTLSLEEWNLRDILKIHYHLTSELESLLEEKRETKMGQAR